MKKSELRQMIREELLNEEINEKLIKFLLKKTNTVSDDVLTLKLNLKKFNDNYLNKDLDTLVEISNRITRFLKKKLK